MRGGTYWHNGNENLMGGNWYNSQRVAGENLPAYDAEQGRPQVTAHQNYSQPVSYGDTTISDAANLLNGVSGADLVDQHAARESDSTQQNGTNSMLDISSPNLTSSTPNAAQALLASVFGQRIVQPTAMKNVVATLPGIVHILIINSSHTKRAAAVLHLS
jgi:hypothetical protein